MPAEQEGGIRGVTRRKPRSLTRADPQARPAPDLIGRDFQAENPGTKPVGAITYLPTTEGWLHLACWLHLLATREAVGYAMTGHHRASLATDASKTAHGRAGLRPGRVVHSDRGSEYTSAEFRIGIAESTFGKAADAPDPASTTSSVQDHGVTSLGSFPGLNGQRGSQHGTDVLPPKKKQRPVEPTGMSSYADARESVFTRKNALWPGRLGPERVVITPGPFGHHSLETG
ncbi:DDE-type integrase/transposase/recombinase [Streptomyces sp. NPDC057101]|uniref:DDE-type integrase/transposase/recombinase n=1 Tax=Streptomyces sp. NPDC057101 TaxID=3346020 RepID=UPI0036398CFE